MTASAMVPSASPASSFSNSPPKVRLAFRVGIVGHRPNRLHRADPAKLADLLTRALTEVRDAVTGFSPEHPDLYASDPPTLRAVSSLAEGTDRIFAEQALALGYELCCPMPFAQTEFEADFQPAKALENRSLERFRGLLERARQGPGLVTFELDGERADQGYAYEAAGRVVLNQSDLLVVVWDGGDPGGRGGTVDTLREAMRYRVPVLWIDAVSPHPWRLLRRESDLACLEQGGTRCTPGPDAVGGWERLRGLVSETLELPEDGPAEDEGRPKGWSRRVLAAAWHWLCGAEQQRQENAKLCAAYFRERRPRRNLAVAWKLFRNLIGPGPRRWPSTRVEDFERAVAQDWSTDSGAPVPDWVNTRLRPHYEWADKLADLYADGYRSAFVLAYPLAALAVFLALLPGTVEAFLHAPVLETALVFAELLVVAFILVLIFWARCKRWHGRWMNYRLLAELIRQLRFLIPLGGVGPYPRLPAHWEGYGNPVRTWMFWHMRAIARATGLPTASVDEGYLHQCLHYLEHVVRGQVDFHEPNWKRSERIEKVLHRSAVGLLAATVGCIVAHLCLPFLLASPPSGAAALLTLACAGFPALGAALAGISNQGEFARIARRSHAMARRLEELLKSIRSLDQNAGQGQRLRLARVTPLAQAAARLMVDEVLDWRVIFLDRPPTLPA